MNTPGPSNRIALATQKKHGLNRTLAIQDIRKRISVNIRRTPYSPTPLESSLNSLFNHVLIILKRPLGKKLLPKLSVQD